MNFSKRVQLTLQHLLIVLAILFCASCASKDAVCRNIYDGLTRQPIVSSDRGIREPPLEEPMSYDQYKYERERLLDKDKKELKTQE
jgi:hypothetical protein